MNEMMQAMQQLQAMQQKMADAQAALENKTVTEETGGGIVRATMSGSQDPITSAIRVGEICLSVPSQRWTL